MRSFYLVLACCLGACIACQPKSNTVETETPAADTTIQQANPAPLPGATCYQAVIKQDTFRLQVLLTDGKAMGTLAYRFKEKDSSYGNIDGAMHGDTLFAIYTYQSEDRLSKREVAFLLSPSEAQEGYGTLEEDGDVMRFATHADLQFGTLMRMKQIACDGQPFDGLRAGQQ
jgi:hypothetical protein